MRFWTREDAAQYHGYAIRFGPYTPVAKRMAELLPEDTRHVVDVCCGTGISTRILEDHAPQVTGIDVSSAMLAHARQYATRSRLVRANADRLRELPQADAIVCNGGYGHLRDKKAFFRKAFDALPAGGALLFSMHGQSREFQQLFSEELARRGVVLKTPKERSRDEIASTLREIGFNDVQIHDVPVDRTMEDLQAFYSIPVFAQMVAPNVRASKRKALIQEALRATELRMGQPNIVTPWQIVAAWK